MRPRFKRSMICDGQHYTESRRAHREYIKEQHCKNVEIIQQISATIIIKKQAYIVCFGKLIPVTVEEIHKIQDIKIIWL